MLKRVKLPSLYQNETYMTGMVEKLLFVKADIGTFATTELDLHSGDDGVCRHGILDHKCANLRVLRLTTYRPAMSRRDAPAALPWELSSSLERRHRTSDAPHRCCAGSSSPAHIAGAANVSGEVLERRSRSPWNHLSRIAFSTENALESFKSGGPPSPRRTKTIATKVSSSGFGVKSVVAHVCRVLRSGKWGPATANKLDEMKLKVSSKVVLGVINELGDSFLAFKFFKWAKLHKDCIFDVHTYTSMISLLGRARNIGGVKHLFAEMKREGCEPNVWTYNSLILAYGRMDALSESRKVFQSMKDVGCKPDQVTYSILIHLHVKSWFLDEAFALFREMLETGIQPDTITYSTVIDLLGKAGKLAEARRLLCEMKDKGCNPNDFTYNSLIYWHAKSRHTKLSLRFYTEMRKSGFPLSSVVCATMIGVFASLRQFEDAESLFAEMRQAGIEGDTAAYSVMINMWGEAGNLDKAISWYDRMLRDGVTPSLTVFTSLVNAHLEHRLYEGAQYFLTSMATQGISPDLKVYTSLLRHCTDREKEEHVEAVIGLMERLGHPAHKFVTDLLHTKESRETARNQVTSFFETLQPETKESKQAFANALIDFLHKLQSSENSETVWLWALEKGLFPASVKRAGPNHWMIDLHFMTSRTAVVALPKLLLQLRDKWVETPTKLVYIVTGWGKRSKVTGSSGVKQSVSDLLTAAKSPFRIGRNNAGVFVSSGVAFSDWISVVVNRREIGNDGDGHG